MTAFIKMDYDAVVTRLGGLGRYQKRQLALLVVPPFMDGITTSILVFAIGHQSFR